ncbi:ribonuclease pancreatic-like [Talpa occidentalis]|uniref:ribonuclease pancreatic-like n=1 Tax=Talpa occidentalis TaxID=50954 RepID=UPI00188E6BE0|nr:ribonuclease pancreatic-like [Talpa occidentalis]
MALKSLVLFSLLVLVLLVLEGAQASQLRESEVEKFKRQHVDPGNGLFDSNYGDQMMKHQNILDKEFNTFVHQPLVSVQAICRESNILCKQGQKNCHKSRSPMSITDYNKKQGTHNYNAINKMRHITIACNSKREPVHYEGSEKGSS